MTTEKLLEIGAAFDAYQESGGPPKADPDVYIPLIDHLKSVNHNGGNKEEKVERPNISNMMPNPDQWNVIMNYYYSIHDYVNKAEIDIEMLANLEIWFIKFIEPRPTRTKKMGFKMDLWKDRELSKYKLLVSDYCPPAYRAQISQYNIESQPLSPDWLHARVIKIEEIYRTTPQAILKKSKDGKTVVRADGNVNQGGVVNLNKILGRD